jgi:hypothetical protein
MDGERARGVGGCGINIYKSGRLRRVGSDGSGPAGSVGGGRVVSDESSADSPPNIIRGYIYIYIHTYIHTYIYRELSSRARTEGLAQFGLLEVVDLRGRESKSKRERDREKRRGKGKKHSVSYT